MLEPFGAVTLAFDDPAIFARLSTPFAEDLSSLARAGDSLFLACDETAGIERLTPVGPGRWGAHRHFSLGDVFPLPGGRDGEMDPEGLAIDDGWLWIAGSHALKRRKAEGRRPGAMVREPNRWFLGRMPLVETASGVFEPVARAGARRAASVALRADRPRVARWLAEEPLLAPFLSIPAKENGVDVEGLAARGDTVWLGLRGPVIGGAAAIVRFDFREEAAVLKPRRDRDGRRCRLHLAPSGGLGVRDLHRDGDDLVILFGSALAAPGPARLVRWAGGAAEPEEGVIPPERLKTLAELPWRGALDQAEGFAPWPEGGSGAWLVVCDSPDPARLDPASRGLRADLFRVGRDGAAAAMRDGAAAEAPR